MRFRGSRAVPIALFTGVVAVVLTPVISPPAHAALTTITVDGMVFEGDPDHPGAGATLAECTNSVGKNIVVPAQVTMGGVTMDVVSVAVMACDRPYTGDSVEKIVIPDTVTEIGAFAFRKLEATSLELGAGVTTIGGSAFAENRLTSLTLPNSVNTISSHAFHQNSLTSVTLPDSLTTLGNGAFEANELTSVAIPASINTLSSRVFAENRLTSFTWDASGPMAIDTFAFEYNDFRTVAIPDGVTKIDERAFAHNPVDSVFFPASVATIRRDAFLYASIDVVTFAGNEPTLASDWANVNGATVYYYKGAAGFAPADWPDSTLVELVTVSFDPGVYGTVPAPIDVPTGSAVTPPVLVDRPGFDFVGWFDAPTGGTQVDVNAVTDHVTLYPRWVDTPESLTAPASAVAGATITLTGDGYQPNEALEIWLLSTPVQLTTLTADAQGAFTTTVTIPANVTPGAHTLEIRGAQSPTFAQSFTVFAALPATGPDPSVGPIGVAALLLAGAGVGLTLINRRRNAPRK